MAGQAALDLVKPYTKSTPARLESMGNALCAIDEDAVPGDVVECGVWRGGNIMLARIMSPQRKCWLYDTFDGMTVPDAKLDIKRSGERAIDRYNAKKAGGIKWDAISLGEVREGFNKLGLIDKCNFVIGPIEETVCNAVSPKSISILRLDVDWYAPTKAALEALYPLVSEYGFLIVDDYGHWMGCQKAVDEFFGERAPLHFDVDYSCRVFRKC